MDGRRGPLVVLEYPGGRGGGMNSKRYQEQVLEGVLKDFYNEMKATRGRVIFQQDGTSSHTSISTTTWFSRENIPLLFHSPNSPDLNPIKPVWHELKKLLCALPSPPSTIEQLRAAILEAWNALRVKDINKYVKSMSDRVEAVAKAKGGHTKY
jgi:transposase